MANKPLCPLCRAGVGAPVESHRGGPGFESTTFRCSNCDRSWSKCTSGAL